MRIALLSDVHANLAALEAVLAHAEAHGAEGVWHTGDLVGYGPDPEEVIARLREIGAACVIGNHDAAVAGLIGTEDFNALAAAASAWTTERITAEGKAFLAALPEVERDGNYTRVHGTLRDPVWEYLVTYEAARAHFELQETTHSVVGHTHLPLVVWETAPGEMDALRPEDGTVFELGERRCCLNPGGVGQPRDGDPRACYALLDTGDGTVTFRRVPYDVAATQRRMIELGLPEALANRLARGR
jgi:diadenosine tetraphosphatase ApaH/serine/threonine PP2A family protein phosphatase